MKLRIDYNTFHKQISSFIDNSNAIIKKNHLIIDETEIEKYKKDHNDWFNQVNDYLKSSFMNTDNDFIEEFNYPIQHYQLGYEKNIHVKKKETDEELRQQASKLKHNLLYLKIIDSEFHTKKELSIDDIQNFILEKLNILNNGNYVSVDKILKWNKIQLNHPGEVYELCRELEELGLIKAALTKRNNQASITIQGRRYLQERNNNAPTNYSKIDFSQEELNNKIDEVIDQLKNLGFGQQIIFEELEELKDLYSHLNKKNWGQILKGKLLDLTIAQVLDKETVAELFKELTNDVLKITS